MEQDAGLVDVLVRPVPAIDRFQRDKSDPSAIVFSEIKRCQLSHFTYFSKSKNRPVPAQALPDEDEDEDGRDVEEEEDQREFHH